MAIDRPTGTRSVARTSGATVVVAVILGVLIAACGGTSAPAGGGGSAGVARVQPAEPALGRPSRMHASC